MYPYMNYTLVGSDLTQILVYLQGSPTHGLFALFLLLSFFLTLLLGSLFMQQRFTGQIRPETSITASLYATLLFEIILEQKSGIIPTLYIVITIALVILSTFWLIWSSGE